MTWFSKITQIFKQPPVDTPVDADLTMSVFDKEYKVIIRCPYDETYMDKVTWLNDASVGNVGIKVLLTQPPMLVVGFENDNDALIFRIRYM
jgi:hypothetical protein